MQSLREQPSRREARDLGPRPSVGAALQRCGESRAEARRAAPPSSPLLHSSSGEQPGMRSTRKDLSRSVPAQLLPVQRWAHYSPFSAHFSSLKRSHRASFTRACCEILGCQLRCPPHRDTPPASPSTDTRLPFKWKWAENAAWKPCFSHQREPSQNVSVLCIKGVTVTPCKHWSLQKSGG